LNRGSLRTPAESKTRSQAYQPPAYPTRGPLAAWLMIVERADGTVRTDPVSAHNGTHGQAGHGRERSRQRLLAELLIQGYNGWRTYARSRNLKS
jgi:hypothetical protein